MFGFGTKNQDKQGPIAEEIENLANTIRNSEVVELSKGNEYANSVANDARDRVKGTLSVIVSEIITSPILLAATSLASGALAFGLYRRYFQRIDTAAYMTPSTMKWRRMLVGKCTSVGDADGFRLYHTPGPPVYRNMLYGNIGKKSHPPNSKTISVRLAGADAPELAHFGKPAQPFAKEAKEELQKVVLGKTVWCQIAHIDQYQRLVATPYVWTAPYVFGRTNVSLHLVKNGLATVYTQTGAAYGTAGPVARSMRWLLGLDKTNGSHENTRMNIFNRLLPLSGESRLKRAMAKAKRRKLGMWSLRRMESPEEFKRRSRGSSPS